ncbi:uracil-DNA glycosylase [Amylocarpus encephaloides]|uniref:Uracil-DNA glycosylase n=1 Tax=Amylocarpus encephaloides TaxID=45428 RepID=A0A9P8C3B3_9HELO|nr:uracil-DNA glycosylase [Amylocarpus encephaloides]
MSLKRKAGSLPNPDAKKPKGTITSFFGQPKPVAGANGGGKVNAPAMRFNKEAWVKGLTDEQRALLRLEIETLDVSWLKELKDEVVSKEFLELKRFLKRELDAKKTIFPPMEDVYAWSTHTPLHTVKAVVIGQDPYHNTNQAHGLCFSIRPPTPAPPSLKNIYIALKKDYPTFSPPPNKGGLLTPWADRGVLLLNTCLTVRAHEANSHANRGWERFTQKVIDTVAAKRNQGIVFLAWGNPAGKRVGKVDRKKHLVLQTVHPSPLSASRGWFDCGHFKKTNEWLVERYGEGSEIDWDLSGAGAEEMAKRKADLERETEAKKVLDEEKRVLEEKKREEDEVKRKETEETLKAMEAIEALEDETDGDEIEALNSTL